MKKVATQLHKYGKKLFNSEFSPFLLVPASIIYWLGVHLLIVLLHTK
jgi:hypothetical protein